jgi:DNA (cytosine-5)-methyltransferase 1
MNYYNEIDPYAAAWLRNLIMADLIAPGDVDERSIEDVQPAELRGYTQCHFFAGIGVWSKALRSAGWSDDRPVWTGSCPCQPFSAAGKGGGFDDERHLWPAWEWLIRHGKPREVPILGEQVASKPGLAWLDVVHADLEGQGYSVGAVDLCAAGVGAPHIRQRLFFVADADGWHSRAEGIQRSGEHGLVAQDGRAGPGSLADTTDANGRSGVDGAQTGTRAQGKRGRGSRLGRVDDSVVGHADNPGSQGRGVSGATQGRLGAGERAARAAGATNGFWAAAEWLACIDGKARPVEPGTFPLAHGINSRVGRLRAYGNAIVAPVAEEFIRAYLAARGDV